MWAWLKALWGSSGGCIAASDAATLSPQEAKLSSRSLKGIQATGEPQQNHGDDPVQIHQEPTEIGGAGWHTPQHVPCSKQDDSGGRPDQQEETATPYMDVDAAVLPESAGRYIYSGGKPVGIANTVTRYQESRPLRPHVTPFEARVEAKIAEEEVAAVLQAKGASGGSKQGSSSDSRDTIKTQLFAGQVGQ